ncbi:MAG: hypothetical protein ACRETO_09000 [Gammaproteobacteria bacterium]
MHQILERLRDQAPEPVPSSLVAGYYEYADSWNDRAIYLRVHYVPLRALHVELYIDFSKPEADVGIRVSLGMMAARFMSLINPEHLGWPCHGQGVGTLLANCTVAFLQAIYPPQALLTGWAPPLDSLFDEEGDRLRQRRCEFWARFGVMLDEYNMFDVKIGDLIVVDDGKSCLEYFPRVLPVSAFRHVGIRARNFPVPGGVDDESSLWLGDLRERW